MKHLLACVAILAAAFCLASTASATNHSFNAGFRAGVGASHHNVGNFRGVNYGRGFGFSYNAGLGRFGGYNSFGIGTSGVGVGTYGVSRFNLPGPTYAYPTFQAPTYTAPLLLAPALTYQAPILAPVAVDPPCPCQLPAAGYAAPAYSYGAYQTVPTYSYGAYQAGVCH
jgi:hypothetical protein